MPDCCGCFSRPVTLTFWAFQLKIGMPLTPAVWNIYTYFDYSMLFFFVFEPIRDRRRHKMWPIGWPHNRDWTHSLLSAAVHLRFGWLTIAPWKNAAVSLLMRCLTRLKEIKILHNHHHHCHRHHHHRYNKQISTECSTQKSTTYTFQATSRTSDADGISNSPVQNTPQP